MAHVSYIGIGGESKTARRTFIAMHWSPQPDGARMLGAISAAFADCAGTIPRPKVILVAVIVDADESGLGLEDRD